MGIESATYISDLNEAWPLGSDLKSTLDNHHRLTKAAIKTTFPNVTGAVTPTHTELNYVDGVTSAIQTQLDGKLPLTGGTISSNLAVTGTLGVTGALSGTTGAFSGAVTGVTATAGDSSTKLATTAYVQTTAFNSALPSQTGNAGKAVITDGTTSSWGVLSVVGGGTGAATLTGLVKGNGTSAMTAAAAGTDYQAPLVSGTNIKTINGTTLLGSGDLVVSASPGDHCVTAHTGNGHGSTNNKIRRFTTVLTNVGTAITYADSSANGASFTIVDAGLYEIHYYDSSNAASSYIGISLNSAELTTAVHGITVASRLTWLNVWDSDATAGGVPISCTRVVRLAANDVIRPHTDGTPNQTGQDYTFFSIRKVGS